MRLYRSNSQRSWTLGRWGDSLPEVPSPESLLVGFLSLIGVSGGVLALVGSAFAIQSWYEWAKRAAAGTVRATSALSSAGHALNRMTATRVALASVATLIIGAAQLLTVGLCYLGGNYISMFFDEPRWRAVVALLEQDAIQAVQAGEIFSTLQLDWISGTYIAIAAVVLSMSYVRAGGKARRDVAGLGVVIGLPAFVLLWLAAAAALVLVAIFLFTIAIALFMLLATGTNDLGTIASESFTNALPLIIGATVCGLYYGACQAAVHGSNVVVRMWRPIPVM